MDSFGFLARQLTSKVDAFSVSSVNSVADPYETNSDYYVLGRDYFRVCTDLELGVYMRFEEALESGSEDWIVDQYKRVRRYVSDCQPSSRAREQEIVEFIQGLGEEELESLSVQVDRAMEYARIAYR